MAGKRKNKRESGFFDDLSPQTKQAIGAVFFAVLGVFFVLSSLNIAGVAGSLTDRALTYLFGYGFVLAPLMCAAAIYVLMKPREDEHMSISKAFGAIVLFLALLGLLTHWLSGNGGLIGDLVQSPLVWLTGEIGASIVLLALALIGVFLLFNTGFNFGGLFKKKEELLYDDEDELLLDEIETSEAQEETEDEGEESEEDTEEDKPKKKTLGERMGLSKNTEFAVSSFEGTYDPPPLSLLNKDKGKAKVGDAKANANIIKRTLKNFGIDVEMDEVSIGPSVTRYALKPAEGVRISKIVNLQNNLELNLAASPIRIEAPIPGKSLVGIEVPNTAKTMIGLASLLASPEYTDSPKPLLIALGKDITGHVHFADIAKMPHALIAGTTGSGKSVTLHGLVTSLLFRNSPDQLRFIMVDPKRVELTLYDGIPHLLTPVITDAKKAMLSLKWAIKEMERRYDILQSHKVRDIASYHADIYRPARDEYEEAEEKEELEELPEPLPYIVIIIDELSDLMQAYPRELESCIVRLAQMSRAVGIHLILATQRPEVKVITGLIKANVPCRVALKVNSQIDSRTILDGVGAEKLLGYGDTLFLSSENPKPKRIQSANVTTEELKRVVKYLKNQLDEQELDAIDLDGDGAKNPDAFFESMVDDGDDDDELYGEAKETVMQAGKASTSFLQRKLGIGYSRAAKLIDILEERGVIGPQNGSKPREILSGPSDESEE